VYSFNYIDFSKMRLSYIPNPSLDLPLEEQAIVERIEARRHPRPLQPLDLTLLHSPHVADGWNSFVGAVRTKTTLPADLRELAICRIAAINQAWYEWMHHAPLAVSAGVPEAAIESLRRKGSLVRDNRPDHWSKKQWAVLLIADEMTTNVKVSDETFALGRKLFTEKDIVEIVATVCFRVYTERNGTVRTMTDIGGGMVGCLL
jgi:alkylhydroperoxidase family enzyme